MNTNLGLFPEEELVTQKIAVIGAGIVGVNCALALQLLGYKVTLIDREAVGAGCSKGNAGHFATEQVFPLAEPSLLTQLPKMLLDPLGPVALSPKHFIKAIPWFIKFFNNMAPKKRAHNSTALKNLNKNAIDYYKPLLAAANAQHLLVSNGSLLVFEHTPYKEVLAIHQHYLQAGIAVDLLDQRQALALEPNLHSKIRYALYFTEVGHTGDPLAICQVLADYAKNLGMEYKQLAIEHITASITGVVINGVMANGSNETAYFDRCVVATGAYSKKLLKGLGYHLPIEAERGYSLSVQLSEDEPALLSRPVASAERKFIITPMDNILRLSGTVEYAGLAAKANNKRADMLLKNAEFVLKKLPEQALSNNESDRQRWMGCRPSLPDSLPVICQAPQHSNIYFALGHQHLGLTQGAITGKLISQLVSGQKTDIDISPYNIERFN
ncbi:FAD-binding oxidoreductase [Colwellia sp. MSW7]|jgi:D-amino-acid dehydrogenase|uniref:FAD-binding oxidoreductase n=1 Tax=Colwellia maritima TaxID=2912588 RepID=A0ABS9WYE8_9GAMM|nr:FAD-binding oxidoreductase [Colwellia maritima]MCI2282955.1 FAD-binding oxidoreductase [Colwellia maritima]